MAQGFLCSPVQPHPVIVSYGIEFWDPGGITAFPLVEQIPRAPGAIPGQIPLPWHGAFVAQGEGQKQKTLCFLEVVFLLCLDTYKNFEFCVHSYF